VTELRFLTYDEVLYLHDDQLARYGGLAGIRDDRQLRSACAMPEAGFGDEYLHKGLFEMAAAYAFHIAEGQAFVDGNKRTGLAAAVGFLYLNGVHLMEPPEVLAVLMLELSEHKDKRRLALELSKLEADGTAKAHREALADRDALTRDLFLDIVDSYSKE